MGTGQQKFFKFESVKIDENKIYFQYLKRASSCLVRAVSVTVEAHSLVCGSASDISFSLLNSKRNKVVMLGLIDPQFWPTKMYLRYKNLLQWLYLRYDNELNNCLCEINLENSHTMS